LRQRLTLILFDCATSAASRVEATEHSVRIGQTSTFPKSTRLGRFLALHFEPGFRLIYATVGITAEHFRKTYIKQLRKAVNDYDRQILFRPDFETALCEASAECFAQGSDGLVRDRELLYRSWAFDVRKIERRVHMWQGMDDRLVHASINKTAAGRMPGAVWHPVEGAGHFVAVVQRTNYSESWPRNWG
jgi:pimeloyl-ACP methyl ester carboxylesterase